jgi:peptide/nickel transport system permease protein
VAAYLIRRVLWAVVLFLAVTAITYAIFFVIPVDPARRIAGKAATPADVERVRHQLGLDDPIYLQYAHYLRDLVVHQSLGYSYANRVSVNEVVIAEAPVTASLVLGGMVIWMLIGVPLGILSALRPRSRLDRMAMVGVLIGISAHPVWIGLVLAYLLGYVPTTGEFLGISFPPFQIFPVQGYCEAFSPPPGADCGGFLAWSWHLLLPWFTLAILYAANYTRMTRATTIETLNEDYVRTARAKGVGPRRVLRAHVVRNSMLPIVTMLGMDVALALGGAVFVEIVFGLPGLGKEAVSSLTAFDYPVTMGLTIFATLVVIVFNLLVDVAYAYLDPRIRLT